MLRSALLGTSSELKRHPNHVRQDEDESGIGPGPTLAMNPAMSVPGVRPNICATEIGFPGLTLSSHWLQWHVLPMAAGDAPRRFL
jgi:hypothetical protein